MEIYTNISKGVNFEKTIRQFTSRHIMVIGDLILDRYIQGKVDRISPEAPIQILKVISDDDVRLGGAANVAHNLVSLGGKVVCLGVIGEDEPGRQLKAKLQKAGIETRGIIQDTRKPTSVKTRMIDFVHSQQVLRVDHEDTEPVHHAIEKQLFQLVKKYFDKCDIILASDYNKGTLTASLLFSLCRMSRRAKKRLIIAPKGMDYSKYTGATAIVLNRLEAELATGLEIKDSNILALRKAARQLIRKVKLEFVVITLGRGGIYLLDKKGNGISERTHPLEVYDVTGAGDTILAALGLALASDAGYETGIHLANLAAGVVVSKVGTAAVNQKELISRVRQIREEISTKDIRNKTRKLDEVLHIISTRKQKNLKVIFTNGCFDILHPGHVKSLQFAKSQGNILIVGLNSDRSVRRLKGRSRPVFNQHLRANSLTALESVDYVVVFDEPTPINLIKRIKPDVLVKGVDWKGKKVVGREIVESYDGKVVFAPLVPGVSTTRIFDRLLKG